MRSGCLIVNLELTASVLILGFHGRATQKRTTQDQVKSGGGACLWRGFLLSCNGTTTRLGEVGTSWPGHS